MFGRKSGGTFQVLKFLTFFVAMQYLLTLTLVFLAILNRQDRNLAGSIVHSIPITRQYNKEPEKGSMLHKEKHSRSGHCQVSLRKNPCADWGIVQWLS